MTIRYLTPEWLDESIRIIRSSPKFEDALKSVTAKICYRVNAEPAWGIDEDMIFGCIVEKGKLHELTFYNEEHARQMSDFILAATPQIWKGLLRKDKKFISEFLSGKVTQEAGSRVALLKITPYANHFIDGLTQFELQFPDEMSADELEAYRTELTELRAKLTT